MWEEERYGCVPPPNGTPKLRLCSRSVGCPAPDLGKMSGMRSDIGIRRSAKDSRSGDVLNGFKVYFNKEPRGLGSYDGFRWRGWAK